jgi:hypothetical protein
MRVTPEGVSGLSSACSLDHSKDMKRRGRGLISTRMKAAATLKGISAFGSHFLTNTKEMKRWVFLMMKLVAEVAAS